MTAVHCFLLLSTEGLENYGGLLYNALPCLLYEVCAEEEEKPEHWWWLLWLPVCDSLRMITSAMPC